MGTMDKYTWVITSYSIEIRLSIATSFSKSKLEMIINFLIDKTKNNL